MGATARVGAPTTKTGHVIRDSALGLVPETVDAIINLNGAVWANDSVRPALLEMLRLRNARTVNCVFCKSVRYDVARVDGLTEDKVDRIADGHQDSDLAPEEKLALAFADVYLKDPKGMNDNLATALQRRFSDREIATMAVSLAAFNASSRCAVSLGGMPESLPIMEIQVPR